MIERDPWPKPLPAPAVGLDPVAHLQRRAPSDPSVTQLVTVRVHGGEDDGAEIWVPLRDIRQVLHRAARYRSEQWPDIGPPDTLIDIMVLDINDSPLTMRMPGGWIEVGKVADPWSGPDWLRVWWCEVSDAVRIERPHGWRRITY